MSELMATLVERVDDRQRHLADDLRLTPTHLVLSRADATRPPTDGGHVARQTTLARPVSKHYM